MLHIPNSAGTPIKGHELAVAVQLRLPQVQLMDLELPLFDLAHRGNQRFVGLAVFGLPPKPELVAVRRH
jgi:hypothetical protein